MSRALRLPISELPGGHRVPVAALAAAVAAHLLVAILLWPVLTHPRAPGRFVTVTLERGKALAPGLPADLARPGAAMPVPAPSEAVPGGEPERPVSAAALVPPPAATTAPSTVEPPEGVSLAPRRLPVAPSGAVGSALSDFWSTRSVAAYVEACRAGTAPVDSVLNPPPTPEQAALSRNVEQFNDFTARLHGEWMLEKFYEAYKQNFPAMH